MSVVIDDEVLHKIQLSEAPLLTEIALMLFQQERFTLEQASRFARMNQLQLSSVAR